LLAKNKDKESNNGGPNGFNCFNWVIDANPQDIRKVDYLHPVDSTPVMRTPADYRQLNDALFHAGTNSGSKAEWEDRANRLHFYILDKFVNPDGILSYQVGVRSLDGTGNLKHGVTAKFVQKPDDVDGKYLRITNTGKSTDIYRLTVANKTASLTNELIAIPLGESREVKVYIGNSASNILTVQVTSESDSSVKAIANKLIRRIQ